MITAIAADSRKFARIHFSLPRDSNVDVFWNHPAGRHCFTINVLDPPDNARYR